MNTHTLPYKEPQPIDNLIDGLKLLLKAIEVKDIKPKNLTPREANKAQWLEVTTNTKTQ